MSASAERTGVVLTLRDGVARVRLDPAPACTGCGSRGTCASGGDRAAVVDVRLEQGMTPGARVTLRVSESSLALGAVLGYLVPMLGLLFGAGLASRLWGGDFPAMVGGLSGFCASLLAVRAVSRRVAAKRLVPDVCLSAHAHGELP